MEALANAGQYAEAEQRLLTLMERGEGDRAAYADMLNLIRFYRNNPFVRDWARAVMPRRY